MQQVLNLISFHLSETFPTDIIEHSMSELQAFPSSDRVAEIAQRNQSQQAQALDTKIHKAILAKLSTGSVKGCHHELLHYDNSTILEQEMIRNQERLKVAKYYTCLTPIKWNSERGDPSELELSWSTTFQKCQVSRTDYFD